MEAATTCFGLQRNHHQGDEGKRLPGRHRRRWKDEFEIKLEEIG